MTPSPYESPAMVATYLEAEWSDWLLFSSTKAMQQSPRAPAGPVIPTFYSCIVEFAQRYVDATQECRMCDVGGSTGRLTFEWLRRFPNTREVVLAEPSGAFNKWSKRLLFGEGPLGTFPIVKAPKRPGASRALRRPPQIQSFSAAKVYLHKGDSNSIPRPDGYFDFVTCLNVADRVKKPHQLVADLERLLKTGGILILASPMDWLGPNVVTPEKERFDSLRPLLPSKSWKFLAETDLEYAVRITNRRAILFRSQVVASKRKP